MKVIGKFIKSVLRKNIKFSRGEGNIMAVGKEISWLWGRILHGKRESHLPYNIEAVGKNIK